MSVCSFISDEGINDSENQSFLEFSLDASHIAQSFSSNVSHPQHCSNLKRLQTLLFQTNFYLKKLEEKMNETQRNIDVEVSLRQLRSHQTVLSLKINSDSIDDSFMNFVMEKHEKIMAEVKKGLDKASEAGNLTEVTHENCYDNTEISSNQPTPAFSAGKNFVFRDIDETDLEVSAKLHEVFVDFFRDPSDKQAFAAIDKGIFKLKYPKITETLEKVMKIVGVYRKDWKQGKIEDSRRRIKENYENLLTHKSLQEKVTHALALQELHLNIEHLPKKPCEKLRENTCSSTQTSYPPPESEPYSKKVEDLERQLGKLTALITSMKKEKASIEKCQEKLIKQINKSNTHEKSESLLFYKDRFETTNKALASLQEAQEELLGKNSQLSQDFASRVSCKAYADQNFIMSKLNESRYQLSSLIKDLEKSRFSLSQDQLNSYISQLHQVSLKLIINNFEDFSAVFPEQKPRQKVYKDPAEKGPSKNTSLQSASEKLDLYLLTQ